MPVCVHVFLSLKELILVENQHCEDTMCYDGIFKVKNLVQFRVKCWVGSCDG